MPNCCHCILGNSSWAINKIDVLWLKYSFFNLSGSGSGYILGPKHAGETDPFSKAAASLIIPFPKVFAFGCTLSQR